MKKFYSFIAVAFCGIAMANAANGMATFQIDLNLGEGEPDLLEPETAQVTGSYENGLLTISEMFYGFSPLALTINLENGEAVAADQIALEEDGLTYYYYDNESKQPEVVGTVSNVGDSKCQLVLQPWGPGNYFSGVGVYFNVLFYNTVFTFDFTIPGLGVEVAEPVLEIESVKYEIADTEYGIYLDFTVDVKSSDLPQGSEIEVFYKGPYDYDFKAAEEKTDGSFAFTIPAIEPNQDYTVEVFAQAGTVVSETVTYPFKIEQSGISELNSDNSDSRLYNLKGQEVRNPAQGEILIRVNNGKAQKVLIK